MSAEVSDLKSELSKLRDILLTATAAKEHVTKLEFQPKALRTSLALAFATIEALRDLLISNGTITELDFYSELTHNLKEEILLSEVYLSEQHGHRINFLPPEIPHD